MRVIALAALLGVALLAGAARAETSQPPAEQSAEAAVALNPLAQDDVSKIIGTIVYDSAGNEIGDVATVLMNPRTRQLDRFVVRVMIVDAGGIFGIGGRLVAVPIGDFSWDGKKLGFSAALTSEALKSMAAWTGPSPADGRVVGGGSNAAGGNNASALPAGR